MLFYSVQQFLFIDFFFFLPTDLYYCANDVTHSEERRIIYTDLSKHWALRRGDTAAALKTLFSHNVVDGLRRWWGIWYSRPTSERRIEPFVRSPYLHTLYFHLLCILRQQSFSFVAQIPPNMLLQSRLPFVLFPCLYLQCLAKSQDLQCMQTSILKQKKKSTKPHC